MISAITWPPGTIVTTGRITATATGTAMTPFTACSNLNRTGSTTGMRRITTTTATGTTIKSIIPIGTAMITGIATAATIATAEMIAMTDTIATAGIEGPF